MHKSRFSKHHKLHFSFSHLSAMRVTALIVMAGILFSFFFMSFPTNTNAQESENKVVRVGWFDSTYYYKDQFGRRGGMAYEYQQKISAYTGWSYEYIDGSWSELFQKLQDGEIDLLADVSYTDDRADKILYPTIGMGREAYYIFIKNGNTEMTPDDIETFNGKVFAVQKGSVMETFTRNWAEINGVEIELRELVDKSDEECIDMLDRGEIDAYVSLDSYARNDVCAPVFQVGSSEFYFAVTKDRPDLLKELNKALNSIQNEDPYYNQRLYQKYLWSVNSSAYLTEKEIAWLSGHGKIKVGYRDDYLPFCAFEDGKLTGALDDFLLSASNIIQNHDIEFEPVSYTTTEGALEALERGEVDVVFPINLSPYDMENLGLLDTENLMRTEIFAVVKPGIQKDIFNDDGIKAALLDGNVNFDIFVQDYYPKWTIEHKQTLDDCYGAVARGDADCAMVNSYRITKNDRLRRHYKLALLATGEDMNFSFAIKKENRELYSIMNKVITLTDSSETETNLSRYAGTSEKITFEDFISDNLASVVAILAIIVALILFLMLTKIRSDKKADDRQKLILATEHDSLTGLYARNYFFEYANRMHKENPDYELDAMVVNIEQFHLLNAIHSWEFGDKVLKVLGEEIKSYIVEHDGIACRSQADRFNIYCKHTTDYRVIYERFQRALNNAFDNVNIRIRMGVMPYEKELEPVELFDRARTACTMVRGNNNVRMLVFSEEMRKREILEQQLLNDLKYAIDNHEFLIYYQPKYDVQNDEPVLASAEALVRWKHHEIGMIPPGQFISLFEKHGQIGLVDKYVWQEAARQISEWKKKFGKAIPVSVNLSRIEIFDLNLTQTINDIIEENGLNRADIHLEVTESAYTDDADQIIGVVSNLRKLGYIIEMDDFGTGYSSLNMFSSMPIDILKLDKSFIDKIAKAELMDERDIRLIELILDIAKSLKLKVVAEGVENENQLMFLKEHGCEMVQGYYFSPPVPADKFEELAFGEK